MVKKVDASSVALKQAMNSSALLQGVIIEVYQPGSTAVIKRIQLKQTMITSIQVSGGLIPTETITLNGLETGDATNIVPTAALPGSLSEVNNNDTSGSRRVSPPALDNNSRISVPLPVPSDPTTVVSLPSASLAASRASITAVNVLAVPSNVRTTQSLDECRQYGGGGLAGVGCTAAMQNHWYIVIWDWSGSNSISGFKLYEVGGGTVPQTRLNGPALQKAPTAIQTISQQAQVRLAILDPAKVGANGCFDVTAYSGAVESARSTQLCITPASATSPVLKSITLTPYVETMFYAYHEERTNHTYCNNTYGMFPFPSGTGVWSKFRRSPDPTGYGYVMSVAFWDGGTQPFPCQNFFTQVLRLGVSFKYPQDLAEVQSATLVTNLGGYTNSLNVDIPCVHAVYQMTDSVNANGLTTFYSAGVQPLMGTYAYDLEGNPGWGANYWAYPTTLTTNSPTPLNPAGTFQWPPKNGEYDADITAVAKQQLDGIALIMQTDDDQIGSDNNSQPQFVENSRYIQETRPICQYIFHSINLELQYIGKSGS